MSSSQPLATCATRVVAGNLRTACRRCTSCNILVKPGKGDQAEPCQHVLDGFGAPFLLEKVLEHWNQAALGRNLVVVAEGNALVRLCAGVCAESGDGHRRLGKLGKWYCHIHAQCYSFSPRLRKHNTYKIFDGVGRRNTNCKLNTLSSVNADWQLAAHTLSSKRLQNNCCCCWQRPRQWGPKGRPRWLQVVELRWRTEATTATVIFAITAKRSSTFLANIACWLTAQVARGRQVMATSTLVPPDERRKCNPTD